jgi:CD36 family
VDVSDVITFMQAGRLFNQETIGDILLNLEQKTYKPTFTNPSFARYLRFIIIEQGLNGIFQSRTPREYIDGFYDPLVYQIAQTPVYAGGDQTNDPFMAINMSPTSPPNNTIVFFTGTDDFLYTRRMARWLDLDYISILKRDYDSLSTLSDRNVEPWDGRVFLDGTDGATFHADLSPDDRIGAMVPDFARIAYFTYESSDKETYKGLELMKFEIDKKLMLN